MKFSAQEEYGLRLLLQIGRAKDDAVVTIPALARAEQLSEPHVAKLLMILRKAGYIASSRGQNGGYRLAKDANEVSVGEVLRVLGGRLYDDEFCARHSGLDSTCTHLHECSLQGLWLEVQVAVDEILLNKKLSELLPGMPQTELVQLQASATRTR